MNVLVVVKKSCYNLTVNRSMSAMQVRILRQDLRASLEQT